MKIHDSTILITGANRGIGRALVEEALRRGAKRVYAGTRAPMAHSDGRVTWVNLDVTKVIQIQGVAKAAALSLTQSLRALLAGRGVSVHAVYPGPVDTDMTRELDLPKASPESVARAILEGVEKGEEDILPDPMSASLAESWRSGEAKALERQFAEMAAGLIKS